MGEFQFKEKYHFEDLLDIMQLLRSDHGCPWDREQTHKTIRANFIEETYEVVEAIDKDDPVLLQEELGDVLLQVVFHAQMEKEKGTFDISGVVDGICRKLILRHPHIFGDVKAETSAQVLKNWDEIKKVEKGQRSQTEVLQSVPKVLPSLMRSYKVSHKAAKAGFDWPDVGGAMNKVHEEIRELEQAVADRDKEHCAEELGDLLFAVVNIARFVKIEPEQALGAACDKFIKRFAAVEELARNQGRSLKDMNIQELDELWNQVKKPL